MDPFTVMTYNIEHMRDLFYKGDFAQEALDRLDAIATVISRISPTLLGIAEACGRSTSHEQFVRHPKLTAHCYQIARSHIRRGSHDLVMYYKDPLELISLDTEADFYDDWIEDIDDDGIREVCEFERIPMEALFRITGTASTLRVLLISLRSKGVFTVQDLIGYQHLALANRKRQLAQARKIRTRLNVLMSQHPDVPIVVMGDFNDEPGMDAFQRMLGASAVETIMGSVFQPQWIFHNVLWHLHGTPGEKDLWTSEYPDLIVRNLSNHKAWLDHILVSPDLLSPKPGLRYMKNSGGIGEKDDTAHLASDHFPVFCRFHQME